MFFGGIMKIFKLFSAIILAVVFCLTACMFGCSANGNNQNNQKESSEYEKFAKKHPDYEGDEEQYEIDKQNGILNDSYEYDLLSEDALIKTIGNVDKNDEKSTFTNGIFAINKPVILPFTSNSYWEMEIEGTITSGQFFNTNGASDKGRFYFGINKPNSILYLGVKVDSVFFNYFWDVPIATLESAHNYKFSFDGEEFFLSIDDDDSKGISGLNFSQNNRVDSTDNIVASSELKEKICATSGQKYAVMSSIGADGFLTNLELTKWTVKTGVINNYRELKNHPLYNKKIFQLGSSITDGMGSDGYSFPEQMDALVGTVSTKEAIGGTTLAVITDNQLSYVQRYAKFNFSKGCDLLQIQLSTNDFSKGIEKGVVTDDSDLSSDTKDKTTMCGAIEYLIAKTKEQSPDTVVAFYSCHLKSNWSYTEQYKSFIQNEMQQIINKWNIVFIDLFNTKTLDYSKHMADDIHPKAVGYAGIFVPAMINAFVDALK